MQRERNPISPPAFAEAVRLALAEDFGLAGDVTSQALIPPEAEAKAIVKAGSGGVLCGLDAARLAFRLTDEAISFKAEASDGEAVEAGRIAARIEGKARSILGAERVALNFLMRMSGIATSVSLFRERIESSGAKICCTRKTAPGLRALDKYAVRCGGGVNHRFGLDDAILVKDNHVAVCGGIASALERAFRFAGPLASVEVEVDSLEQFREALSCVPAPNAILLDNMTPQEMTKAVALNRQANGGAIKLEASGNVTLETVESIAASGVDFISTSAITMSSAAVDFGLDLEAP